MTDSSELTGAARRQRGFLGFVEKVGNVLPDPIMIFVYLIGLLMILSAIGEALGWSASLSYPGEEAPEGADAGKRRADLHARRRCSPKRTSRDCSPKCRAL
jgi:p-aminobenzoyl-glutamate transporter AbgT